MDNRTEVREFLTARRARLTPEDVGLPDFGGRRHVKGLRREEVAMLAGVSSEYYARLERGDIAGVSDQVLDALYDKRITEVIGELSTRSEVFRDRWANAVVHRHDAGLKVAIHPAVGELSLHMVGTEIITEPGVSLMVYAAEPGTAGEEKLQLLASWAATEKAAEPSAAHQTDSSRGIRA